MLEILAVAHARFRVPIERESYIALDFVALDSRICFQCLDTRRMLSGNLADSTGFSSLRPWPAVYFYMVPMSDAPCLGMSFRLVVNPVSVLYSGACHIRVVGSTTFAAAKRLC